MPLAYVARRPGITKRRTAPRSVKKTHGVSGTAGSARDCAGAKRNAAAATSAGTGPANGRASAKRSSPLPAMLTTDSMR